jgi:hypothetical protein
MNLWKLTMCALIMTILVLCCHEVSSTNPHVILRRLSLPNGSSENEDNEQNKDVTCPCENDDVGLKYICDSLTNDVESCMLHVAKSLRHIYGNNANEPFKRIRKQLSFNGAISSIAGMLNGEQMRNRDAFLRSRIQMMG